MAKPIRLSPKKSGKSWRLSIPPKLSPTGKRQNLLYRTQALALEAAAKLKGDREEFGNQAKAISPTLADQAHTAAELLKDYNAGLMDAVQFYIAAKCAEATSKPTSEALTLWIADSKARKLRGKSLTNYKQTQKRFAVLGKKMLSAVTREDLQNIVAPAGMAATSAAAHYRNGSAFWNWCARREWCDAALFVKLDRPATPQRKRIIFLEPEAAEALLKTAAVFYPAAVGHFAVGLFAGVRPKELERLNTLPELVKPDGIDVGADESKGESRRHITPCETLTAWLTKHPFQTVPNWQRVWDAVRRLAGWAPKSEFADELVSSGVLWKLPEPFRGDWPQDVMRHSAGTYHVARGENLANMAFWFGHTGGETTLRRFYVGKAKRKDALEFFTIMPEGVKAPAAIQAVA